MCDQMTLLAQLDAHRYVVCCEHGVTHIIWNNFSMRIETEQIAHTAKLLQELSQLVQQYRIASSKTVCAVRDQHDNVQVWITGCGLYLNRQGFFDFITMMQEAGDHCQAVETTAQTSPACQPVAEAEPHQVRRHLFSIN